MGNDCLEHDVNRPSSTKNINKTDGLQLHYIATCSDYFPSKNQIYLCGSFVFNWSEPNWIYFPFMWTELSPTLVLMLGLICQIFVNLRRFLGLVVAAFSAGKSMAKHLWPQALLIFRWNFQVHSSTAINQRWITCKPFSKKLITKKSAQMRFEPTRSDPLITKPS